MVSRVIGKPGVILVSEGAPTRVGHMLTSERKKTARWVPDIPIYEIQIGDAGGRIALRQHPGSDPLEEYIVQLCEPIGGPPLCVFLGSLLKAR